MNLPKMNVCFQFTLERYARELADALEDFKCRTEAAKWQLPFLNYDIHNLARHYDRVFYTHAYKESRHIWMLLRHFGDLFFA